MHLLRLWCRRQPSVRGFLWIGSDEGDLSWLIIRLQMGQNSRKLLQNEKDYHRRDRGAWERQQLRKDYWNWIWKNRGQPVQAEDVKDTILDLHRYWRLLRHGQIALCHSTEWDAHYDWIAVRCVVVLMSGHQKTVGISEWRLRSIKYVCWEYRRERRLTDTYGQRLRNDTDRHWHRSSPYQT